MSDSLTLPFYLPTGYEVEVATKAYEQGLPLLLKGPTGCGKTRFVEYLAASLGRELITVSCNEDTSATDLLGRHLLQGGETVWVDGPCTRAVREGAILYLDEVAEARADAIVVIHALTDHRRELYLDRTGERLKAPDPFSLIVSYNPGYQRSLRELKPSTRQRFIGLAFDYPDEKREVTIVETESGVESAVAKRLVKMGRKIRELTELNLMESVSTRLLIAAGKLIRAGVPSRRAAMVAVAQPLTDDPDPLAALQQLIEISL